MWLAPTGLLCGAMPKTGTTFAHTCAKVVYGPANIKHPYTTHAPLFRADGLLENAVGTTRGPGAWYASIWLHIRNLSDVVRQGELSAYAGGGNDFRSFLFGATHPREVRGLPATPGLLTRAHDASTDDLAVSGWGLWSWLHVYHYADRRSYREPHAVRWLAKRLIDIDQGHVAMSSLLGRDLDVPKANTADRYTRVRAERPYRDWYDDEMVGWVRAADGWLLGAIGRDVFGPARDPLIQLGGE